MRECPVSLILTWQFVIGVLAAAVYAGLLRLLDERRAQPLFAAGLLIAALIYVGFAGLNHGTTHLGLELSGLLIFGLLSVIGVRRWPLILGLGWLAHGGWDFWHAAHPSGYVPSWWPGFCVGFDWVVGVYLLAVPARRSSKVIIPARHL